MTLAEAPGNGVPETILEASMPTGNPSGRFKCEQCGKTFKSMIRLRNHTRTHPVSLNEIQDSLAFLAQHDISQRLETQATDSAELPGEQPSPKHDQETFEPKNLLADPLMSPAKPVEACANTRRRSGIPVPQCSRLADRAKAPRRSLQVTEIAFMRKHTMNSASRINTRKSEITNKTTKPLHTQRRSIPSQTTMRSQRNSTALKEAPAPGTTPSRSNGHRRSVIGVGRNSLKTTPTTLKLQDKQLKSLDKKTVTKTNVCKSNKKATPTRGRAKLSVKSTTRNRSTSNKRTPKNGKKTPNGNKATPRSNGGTPVNTQRNTPKGNRHTCNRCGKGFMSQRLLDIHYVIHVRDTPKACGIPNKMIKKKPRRLQMAEQTTPSNSPDVDTRIYACAKCNRVYQRQRYLQAHMKTHTIDRPYGCDVCKKSFKFLSSLKSHKITHVGEKTHIETLNTIAKGGKLERRRSSMAYEEECDALNLVKSVRNIFSVTDDEKDSPIDVLEDFPYICKSCDFKTNQPVALLTHMKCHSARRPYTCVNCHKTFASKSNLDMHSKVHVIERLRHVLTERGSVVKM